MPSVKPALLHTGVNRGAAGAVQHAVALHYIAPSMPLRCTASFVLTATTPASQQFTAASHLPPPPAAAAEADRATGFPPVPATTLRQTRYSQQTQHVSPPAPSQPSGPLVPGGCTGTGTDPSARPGARTVLLHFIHCVLEHQNTSQPLDNDWPYLVCITRM